MPSTSPPWVRRIRAWPAPAPGIVTVVDTVAYGSAVVLLSLALVGSFAVRLRTPRRWVRWMADSSYWIYLMHLPVVAFLTFWLAHLDASGRLTALTGFDWGPELKFSVAFVTTSAIGVVSYRYLVRYNRARHPAQRQAGEACGAGAVLTQRRRGLPRASMNCSRNGCG